MGSAIRSTVWFASCRHLAPGLGFLALFLAFGLLVMPFLIYLAGVLTLGPYEGGLLAFLGAPAAGVLHRDAIGLARWLSGLTCCSPPSGC